MKTKNVFIILFVCIIFVSCTPTAKTLPVETPIPSKSATLSVTPSPTPKQEEMNINQQINCSTIDVYIKCVDNILNVEFEYPISWGKIEAILRTGGISGYAYDYRFYEEAAPELLLAGGRSLEFSEGREGMSTDFAGYGDIGFLSKKGPCDNELDNLFPICKSIKPNVAFMVRFPNSKYFCENAPFNTKPIFRIEVNLPDNLIINGFVFEASFLSEDFFTQVKSDLYSLLGIGSDMFPTKCSETDRQFFETQFIDFIDKIENRRLDKETQSKFDELIHLAESIQFR